MLKSLSIKDKILMTLYRKGVKGMREKLILELPKRTAEWTELAREVLSDLESEHREFVVRHLMRPRFIEDHPLRAVFVAAVQDLMSSGVGAERRIAIEFVTENLHLFPVDSDSFQVRVIGLQSSTDTVMATAADDLLEKMGIDMRDPALLGNTHDAQLL